MRLKLIELDSQTLQEPSGTNQEVLWIAVKRPEVIELDESDD